MISKFRAVAARANYLSADRIDIQFAVKEICRGMANPDTIHWEKLKRLARYLLGCLGTVSRYEWQAAETEVIGYTDSDWAGCRVSGQSTSGRVL